MVSLKKFLKVGKNYIDYIMKLGFSELLVNFIELIILVAISLLVMFPVSAVKVILYSFVSLFTKTNQMVYLIYNIVFLIINAVISLALFIYMFNKRYEDIESIRNRKRETKIEVKDVKNGVRKIELEDESMELPKPAQKKRF